ncbi:MAG: excinuclease ABC subunit UvrC [Myxococcota bacterium]|nr:excinuclease ABC subunit UvrC [Myxococcota bacterium]
MSLQERAASLPTDCGVYLFRGRGGKVLYVGKAQNLKSRVGQYVSGGDGRLRIPVLMERVVDVEVVVTQTIKEALLLENELIKRHKPVFNVRLRDDKQYLTLRLDEREQWPRLTTARRFGRDGAEYFGPYTSSIALKETLSNLRRIFPLRSCTDGTFRDYQRRKRPCIEYEMKRCVGPCCDLVKEDPYREIVRGTVLFLRGRSEKLVDDLHARMKLAAEQEDFEEAGRIRDRIQAVERTVESQQIISKDRTARDVFGIARRGSEVEVQVLHVREGRVVGAEGFGLSDVRIDDGDVMGSFISQYYADDTRPPPKQILSSESFRDGGVIEEWLGEQTGGKVRIKHPQRGDLKQLVGIASDNASLTLARRLEARESVDATLAEIERQCHLSRTPRLIECYDVSNLQGALPVASRVVFVDGRPAKKDYRRYRIREAAGGDDYACLREVIGRRLARVEADPLPDLLMVDGGRGQLGVVLAALADAGHEVDTLGLAKERDAESPSPRVKRGGGLKAERIFLPNRTNPVRLHPGSKALLLLQRVRDESHRFAIEFQRELRLKTGLTSILQELPGIGPVKQRALLKTLGSLRAVREATDAELAKVPGISQKDASTIRGFFEALREAPERPESE